MNPREPIGIRPRVHGKFLIAGDEKLCVRGVTYGTFEATGNEAQFPDAEIVRDDFRQMAAYGINSVRTYTVPPIWLLDLALQHGLRIMVGLPWEEHTAFLDDRRACEDIERRVRLGVRACDGHPAILCFAVGNEIPASIVRWHGRQRVQLFLRRIFEAAKEEDGEALLTYVNYPSTEYLDLPFLDFASFNVYVECPDKLTAYVARLHNLIGDRPLVLTELGLDSRRNGLEAQAESLRWQIKTSFAQGSAGIFVFSWTDEWHRGGHNIEDWDFGLTTRDRQLKPALLATAESFSEAPLQAQLDWPRISVVVCTYNGSRTLADCLEGVSRLNYPDFEVIVVDDGSTDETPAIAGRYRVRLISTENRGLAGARNTGMEAATGEIIAYIDDDAWPDPDWLTYLAWTFMSTNHVGAGGPNLAPPDDGLVAECVANSPGGPLHVLLSDTEAEHIPGCNMAYRKRALEEVGGFDPIFRAAGDDVDVCWRLRGRGGTIGFHPTAMVWHHRRNSLKAYWRQQVGYGKAEALLERKWPERYNGPGHLSWAGRLYGRGATRALGFGPRRVYHGPWGSAPFQSLYQPGPGFLASLPQMPEWYLATATLAALSGLGIAWPELLLLATPLLVLSFTLPIWQAGLSVSRIHFNTPRSSKSLGALRLVTLSLHMTQPLARLWGRLRHGLTPVRSRGGRSLALPRQRTTRLWTGRWQSPTGMLTGVMGRVRRDGVAILAGGAFDRWDLEVRGGLFGGARLLMTVEEHGGGIQQFIFRSWPRLSTAGFAITVMFATLAAGAALSDALVAFAALTFILAMIVTKAAVECAAATSTFATTLTAMDEEG
ncbi:MAG: glycosyltransferase [Dehalococcoidia bacterium]|nr:glycosyltransferase [Dehalococcoidia bacterium]